MSEPLPLASTLPAASASVPARSAWSAAVVEMPTSKTTAPGA